MLEYVKVVKCQINKKLSKGYQRVIRRYQKVSTNIKTNLGKTKKNVRQYCQEFSRMSEKTWRSMIIQKMSGNVSKNAKKCQNK